RPFYKPYGSLTIQPLKSFPSGHAAAGFYLMSLAFVGYRIGSKKLMWTGAGLGLIGGGGLGLVRMAQGAHFLTDVFGSAWVMFFSAQLCDWLIYKPWRKT